MTEHDTRHKVVVIGGGYAGTPAANRLRMRADVDIALVSPRPEFVERPRLHQFVAGTGGVTVDHGELLGEDVRLAVDSTTRIDTSARAIAGTEPAVIDRAAIKELTYRVAVPRIRREARRPGSTVRVKGGRRLEQAASAARMVPVP